MVMELPGRNGVLRLTVGAESWCHVELAMADCVTPLGADTLRIVKQRLRSATMPSLELQWVDSPDGAVAFVMSFYEHHATIYALDAGDLRVLVCQNAQAKEVGRLELSKQNCRTWIALLTD